MESPPASPPCNAACIYKQGSIIDHGCQNFNTLATKSVSLQQVFKINKKLTLSDYLPNAKKAFLLLLLSVFCSAGLADNLPAPALSVSFDNGISGPVLSFTARSDADGTVDGYNLYLDGDYQSTHTTQPIIVPASQGGYCVVAFQRSDSGEVDFSVCSNTAFISSDEIESRAADGLLDQPEQRAGAQPTGLRAEVFSATALELYWDRAPRDLVYTVSRDGQVIGETRGTSFWSPNLLANTNYEFEVSTGEAPSAILVVSTSPGNASQPGQAATPPVTPSTPATNTGGPAAAQAPRIEFYSPTVAELFWQHTADVNDLDEYLISLNGQAVGSTNGTSLFLPDLAQGREHLFEIVALDRQGRQSTPAALTIGSGGSIVNGQNAGNPQPVATQNSQSSVAISSVDNQPVLLEGNSSPVVIPVSLQRPENVSGVLELKASAIDDWPGSSMVLSLNRSRLEAGAQRLQAELRVTLPVGRRPLIFHPRRIRFSAARSDGTELAGQFDVTVNVSPVQAEDVYLLIGQSNMVGFSELGAKQAGPGGADETLDRIRQLNVTSNNMSFYSSFDDYSSTNVIVGSPRLIRAEDPLHELLYPWQPSKGGTFIGPGLSFAKGMLAQTTQGIILVPAAWSGTGFCRSGVDSRGWNATGGSGDDFNGLLGGSELSNRAIARLNIALSESAGIFRGIIWHQGEADSNNPDCSSNYAANLRRLVERLRSEPIPDRRGSAARNAHADIPFVVATMSRGNDDRGFFSIFSDTKRQVDSVHRLIANEIPFSGFVNVDDLVPPAFPCGTSSCIHFGAEAYREMGRRYARVMQEVLSNP